MLPRAATALLVLASAGHAAIPQPFSPKVTQAPVIRRRENSTDLFLLKRIETELSTCGYYNGDPSRARTADKGFNCRVDTQNGLWGFCPTSVITASDCGLAGACIDSHACSNVCGKTTASLTTFTCKQSDFCSLVLLTFGVDQTYSYHACGATAVTEHLLVSPTPPSTTGGSTTSQSTTKPPSIDPAGIFTASKPSNTDSPTGTTGTQSAGDGGGATNNTGPIIGGVIGGLALICASVLVAIYLWRRGRRQRNASSAGGPHRTPLMGGRWATFKHKQHDGWGPRELPADNGIHGEQSEPIELSAEPRR